MSGKPDETIAAAGAARPYIRRNAITPSDTEKMAGLPLGDEGIFPYISLQLIIPSARTKQEYHHDKFYRNLNSWNCLEPCDGEIGLSGEATE